jgi:hypothetical protein
LYSSYPDYYGYRKGTLCNKELAMQLFSFSNIDFKGGNSNLDGEIIKGLF